MNLSPLKRAAAAAALQFSMGGAPAVVSEITAAGIGVSATATTLVTAGAILTATKKAKAQGNQLPGVPGGGGTGSTPTGGCGPNNPNCTPNGFPIIGGAGGNGGNGGAGGIGQGGTGMGGNGYANAQNGPISVVTSNNYRGSAVAPAIGVFAAGGCQTGVAASFGTYGASAGLAYTWNERVCLGQKAADALLAAGVSLTLGGAKGNTNTTVALGTYSELHKEIGRSSKTVIGNVQRCNANFSSVAAANAAIEQIPPPIFSEIMTAEDIAFYCREVVPQISVVVPPTVARPPSKPRPPAQQRPKSEQKVCTWVCK